MTEHTTWPGWTHSRLESWIDRALEEDLEGTDITAWTTIPHHQEGEAIAVAKQELVLCGLPVAEAIFRRLGAGLEWESIASEGSVLAKGEQAFKVKGEIHAILAGERLVLNVLQHLSGIATTSRAFFEAVAGTSARVVDTRKTLPGLRFLQRYAVRVGGCHNHRYHLGSGILIKENHIRAAGSIGEAIAAAQSRAPHTLRIEIEVTDFDEMEQALQAGADIVMLDNMTPAQVAEAVALANGRAILEASGNVGLHNVREYAEAGVDVISVGALTHSVKAADISLLVK